MRQTIFAMLPDSHGSWHQASVTSSFLIWKLQVLWTSGRLANMMLVSPASCCSVLLVDTQPIHYHFVSSLCIQVTFEQALAASSFLSACLLAWGWKSPVPHRWEKICWLSSGLCVQQPCLCCYLLMSFSSKHEFFELRFYKRCKKWPSCRGFNLHMQNLSLLGITTILRETPQ